MKDSTLSALIIAQNEAHQIAECLESLRWADEIIVVDGGSADGTAEIARRYTPHVFVHPWRGYALQRRFALEKATGSWILAVDADERIPSSLADEIRHIVARDGEGYDGFYIARKSYFLGKWIRRAGWFPGYQLRLCRRERTHVTDRAVHEGLVVEGKVGYLTQPMLHFTYPTLESALERVNRYTTLEVIDRGSGSRVRPADLLFHPLGEFLKKYIGLAGFAEGVHGLVLAATAALYKLALYAKIWEAEHPNPLPKLDFVPPGRENRAAISVLVMARNEEKNIRDCLLSARWADELVVVDTGSTDATPQLAHQLADRVIHCPWRGYAATKQAALADLRHGWVLWLDADERVTPALAQEIAEAIRSPEYSAYEVPRLAWFLGRWIRHSGWYPGYVVRLFRKDRSRFSDSLVHEGIEVKGQVGRLRSPLLHFTDPTVAHYLDKFNRYTSLAAEQEWRRGRRFRLTKLLLHPPHTFFRMYLLRQGFRDGVQGWMLALFSAAYVFFKYAKLWEHERQLKPPASARPVRQRCSVEQPVAAE
ncbi:MAG: glycosyltransferase family 2 protein [candidate division KSB1 bacterium]|nr:glycosyltransferase family 2 protein [candidate division KSB1 bacterium]